MAQKSKPVSLWRPEETTIDVRSAIVDRTTTAGMTTRAISQLKAAVVAAQRAGLARIEITAARGGGHKSHFAGSEWDIVGYNASGALWSRDQRVMVAEGTRRSGATRFGLYESGKTLHFGYGPKGFADNITWGAGGLTSGDRSRQFSFPVEREFAQRVASGRPYLAYDEIAQQPLTVPAVRAIELQLASTARLLPDLPKGTYGEDGVVRAALAGDPKGLKAAFDTLTKNALGNAGFLGSNLPNVQKEIEGYFTEIGKSQPETARQVKTILDGNPEMWSAVPEAALPAFRAGFAALPEPPVAKAVGVVVPFPRLRPGVKPVEGEERTSLARLRVRVLDDGRTVRKGTKGETVRELQRFLNAQGYKDAKGRSLRVDGDMGPRTKQALAAYQRDKGLRPDGVVGPRTFAKIAEDVMPLPRLRPTPENLQREVAVAQYRDRAIAAGATGEGLTYLVDTFRQNYGRTIPPLSTGGRTGMEGSPELPGQIRAAPVVARDPFGTRILGKDQSRLYPYASVADADQHRPAGVAPQDIQIADEAPTPPPVDSLRATGQGGLLGGVLTTFESVANASRAMAREERNQQRRREEAAARPSQATISLSAFAARFGGATAAAASSPNFSAKSNANYRSTSGDTIRQPGPSSSSVSSPSYTTKSAANTVKASSPATKAQPSKAVTNTKSTSSSAPKQSATIRTDAAGRILGGI